MSHFSTTSVRKSWSPFLRSMKRSSLSLFRKIPVFENEGVYSTPSQSEKKDSPVFGMTNPPCSAQKNINSSLDNLYSAGR